MVELNKKNRNHKIYSAIGILIFLSIICVLDFSLSNAVWHSSVNKYIDKVFNQSINIRGNDRFSYKGNNYRIIFGTSKDNEEYIFLQCFKEKLNGLFYEPTYGAESGKSKALYGMTNHFISGSNESFVIVYGYNKGGKASNFSVRKTGDGEWVTQDISKQDYFIYIYPNIEYGKIVFKDAQGKDISMLFNGY